MTFCQYFFLFICLYLLAAGYFPSLCLSYGANHSTILGQSNTSTKSGEFASVTLFEHHYYKGTSLTIFNEDAGRCFNFYRSNYSTTSFYKYITSIQLNGNCVVLYDGLGCTGNELMVSPQNNTYCQRSLGSCNWNDLTSSLRFCDTIMPQSYPIPKGSTGDLCADACLPRQNLYFWCTLKNGSRDLCSPRPGVDHFGNECQDCSVSAASRRHLLNQVVLFQFDAFIGKHFEVERKQRDECINIRYYNDSDANFDNRASSVMLGENCVVLHEHIGCSGRSLKLDWNSTVNNNCYYHLKKCNFDDMTSSVSFCDANFPDNYESSSLMGHKGSNCIDSCEARGKPYFWCNTQNGSWDYCSPRPGVDFLGNSCQDSCIYNDTTFPQSVVLYENEHQKGREYRMDEHAETLCWNFGYTSESQSTPKVVISSIYLDSSCVQLYDNIGCSGNYFELTSEIEDNCWSKIKTCSKYNKIVSAKLCTVELPSPYDPAFGISGSRCYSRCHTRSRHYFWCHLEDNSWDFCSPRPGLDYFGDRYQANCSSPERAHAHGINVYELGPSKSENQEAELFVGLQFQAKSTTITNSKEVKCFNLGYDENLSVNFNHMVYSIRLSSANLFTCVVLHDSVGCTGNFLVMSSYDNVECHENLENCNWSTRVSSISFCDTRLPRKFPDPKGITGQLCIDDCTTRGKPYFWCHLADGSQEFCIPRPGQSYLGNFCSGNCTQDYVPEVTPGFGRRASLYIKEWFRDKHITVDTVNMPRCLNLGYDAEQDANFNNAIYSVAIDHEVCLRLHDSIGCVGKYLDVSHEVNIKCHRDLQSCGWHQKVSSVSLCSSNTSETSLSSAVVASRNFNSPCEAEQADFFCCEFDTSWNFCFPRTGQNDLGEKWPAKYVTKFGISAAMYDLVNRKCINLRNDTGYVVNGRIEESVSIALDCVVLYENVGCTGESFEVYPEDKKNCHRNLKSCEWENTFHQLASVKRTFLQNTINQRVPKGASVLMYVTLEGSHSFGVGWKMVHPIIVYQDRVRILLEMIVKKIASQIHN